MITKAIFDEYKLEMNNMYLDGSKFEANANKYKFVWKPTIFHNKISDKINELSDILKNYDLDLKENKIHNNNYKLLVQYLEKSLEYEEKERICGPNRNSYYKTDNDATAMCLKEEYS